MNQKDTPKVKQTSSAMIDRDYRHHRWVGKRPHLACAESCYAERLRNEVDAKAIPGHLPDGEAAPVQRDVPLRVRFSRQWPSSAGS